MRLEIESAISSPVFVENDSTASADVGKMLKQGVSAAQGGDRPMARTFLTRVTEADPDCVDAWLWLASISEYPEELLVFLKKVLDIEPGNERALSWEAATRSLLAKTHVQRGVIAREEGKHSFAVQCFDEAVAFDDRCESAWYGKASLAANDEEKLEFLGRVLSIDPEHADAKDALKAVKQGRVSSKIYEAKRAAFSGDFDAASEMLDEIHRAEPDNCEAWVLHSHVARSFEEKLDAYSQILKFDPSNAFAQFGHDFLAGLAESNEDAWPTTPEADSSTIDLVAGSEQVDELAEEIFVEKAEPEQDWAAPFVGEQPSVEEAVAEKPWSGPDAEFETAVELFPDESNETEMSDKESEAAAEPEIELTLDDDVDMASRDTAESIDPFAVEVTENESLSMVAEEAARDAEMYASPTAETHEFRANEHDFQEIVADDDLLEMIDDTQIPSFANDRAATGSPSPWDSPVDEQAQLENRVVAQSPGEFGASVENTCPYCSSGIERQSFSCSNCRAILSLSDIESLLADNSVNFDEIRHSVARMEAEWNTREFSAEELKSLGIGQFNLKNFELGFAYLQEASRQEPNDVILAGQLNALAIRLDEIKRQDEIKEAMPKGKSILVVDDSATVRKLISSKLEKSGHQVICAVDGVEAMAMIENTVPDLVLLDIAMPRMDGYQVCKLIRANDAAKDVPVVMISGKDGFFDKVRGRMAGTTGYITKPFGPETLMKALETYLVPETAAAE